MLRSGAARARDGLRRRIRYRNVKATAGTVLQEFHIRGVSLLVADLEGSVAAEVVAGEIALDDYAFTALTLQPGDIVVDLGSHIGLVSMYLAKKHPEITVYAYEPLPPIYALLVENLRRNRVRNVVAHNLAVAPSAGNIELVAHLGSNTGGATSCYSTLDLPGHDRFRVTTTLDDILTDNGIRRCALLKIDIEGAEHEVLTRATLLERVENVRGEFHENARLREQGHSIELLEQHCAQRLGVGAVRNSKCSMPDL